MERDPNQPRVQWLLVAMYATSSVLGICMGLGLFYLARFVWRLVRHWIGA